MPRAFFWLFCRLYSSASLQVDLLGFDGQPLLGVKIGQLEGNPFVLRIEAGDPLVHGDGLGEKAFLQIKIGDPLELLERFGKPVQFEVQIADDPANFQVIGFHFDYFLVFLDGRFDFSLFEQFLGQLQDFQSVFNSHFYSLKLFL